MGMTAGFLMLTLPVKRLKYFQAVAADQPETVLMIVNLTLFPFLESPLWDP